MRTTIEPGDGAASTAAALPAAPRGDPAGVEAVLAELGRAVGSLRCAGSQRLVRLGISMTHFHVLTLLRHHDAMPMGRLAEILDASMSSATGIIDRMEERGLVRRVRVPDDRRIVLVEPTETGLDLVDEVELVKSDIMTAALARLSADRLDRLAAAIGDLHVAVSTELASAPEQYAALAECEHGRDPRREAGHGADRRGHDPIHSRPESEPGAASHPAGPAGA
jgi:DNA-binding MarR family transcriptional regulator